MKALYQTLTDLQTKADALERENVQLKALAAHDAAYEGSYKDMSANQAKHHSEAMTGAYLVINTLKDELRNHLDDEAYKQFILDNPEAAKYGL